MSKPRADQLAQNVPPAYRAWAEARMAEMLETNLKDLRQQMNDIQANQAIIRDGQALIKATLTSLENRFNADTRIQLTRARVAEVYRSLTEQSPSDNQGD